MINNRIYFINVLKKISMIKALLIVLLSLNTLPAHAESELFEEMLSAAEQGSQTAQYKLAKFYYNKYNRDLNLTQKDLYSTQALHWFKRSAEQNDVNAQAMLGQIYSRGHLYGIPEDKEYAIHWYKKAAEQGHAYSQLTIARFYRETKQLKKMIYWYHQAAEQGHVRAQFELARLYEQGREYLEPDFEKTLYWLQQVAEQDVAYAQEYLARIYLKGEITPKNPSLALFWFQQAAAKNDMRAQFMLGRIYEKGIIVSKDLVKAVEYYEKGLKHTIRAGMSDLEYKLALIYLEGKNNVEKNIPRALYWLQNLGQFYHEDAQYQLALLYEKGSDVPKDSEKMLHWLTKSAENGHKISQYKLGVIYEQGQYVIKNICQARYWYKKAAQQCHKQAQTLLKQIEENERINDLSCEVSDEK